MNRLSFRERLASDQVIITDGATGTNLQARGLERGMLSEEWVLERPEKLIELMQDFIAAGADMVLSSTFNANPLRLEASGLRSQMEAINKQAVKLAHEAVNGTGLYVGASIGPSGLLMKPYGPLDESEVFDNFVEQAEALKGTGVEFFAIETQYDLNEALTIARAIRSVSNLPLICSFSYDRGTRTMMGVRPAQVGQEFSALNVDILGINCGRSLDDNLKNLRELRAATKLPIWFKPNAGMPRVDEQQQTTYDITPEIMGAAAPEWLQAGALLVGGCCGTTPEHLHQIALAVKPE